MKNKITATIITKNEEANIEKCLKSLFWVNEIVIVDSGSEDKTIDICKKYNCNIYDTGWLGFGITKKFAVDKASNNWIFSIDADEVVSDDLRTEVLQILEEPKFNGYKIKRKSFYLGQEVKYCGWNKDFPLRLFDKRFGNFNDKTVHESVKVSGDKGKIFSTLLHYTYPTIQMHIRKINRYTDLGSDILRNKGKEYSVTTAIILGLNKFIKMFILQKGFLDGKIGFILSINSAFGIYLKYVKLWKPKV